MTNDSKLGMLVGVLGVIAAAVLFTNPPQPVESPQPSAAESQVAPRTALPTPPEVAREVAPYPSTPALREVAPFPSTPVARTRTETEAQTTRRSPSADEEP
jgi:hypothetical protein